MVIVKLKIYYTLSTSTVHISVKVSKINVAFAKRTKLQIQN